MSDQYVYSAVRSGRVALMTFCAALLMCLPAWSQGNLGRIVGAVTDPNGGAVANATVTILDVQRGVTRVLMTDAAGEYSAPGLIPGTYEVTVEVAVFSRFDRQNISLLVGQELRIDAALSVGAQTQTITVTEAVPDIVTTNATLGGVVENQELTELPLSGRNYLHLLDTKPGVQMKPGGGPNSYVSNGQRNAANGYMVDGLFSGNVNTGASAVLGGGSGAGGPEQANVLPVDGIQEINVMQNPKAEYGPRPEAYINIGLKSGTNSSALSGTIAFKATTTLTALQAFMAGIPNNSATANSILVGNPNENLKWNSYWGYLQDDWRVTRRIILNLGLRYDYEAPMREASNNVGGFDPTAATGLFQRSTSHSLWNPSKKDFGPRVGIAWDVNGTSKTVVRAAFGIFYEPFITQIVTTQEQTWAVPTGASLILSNGTIVQGPGNLQNGNVSGRRWLRPSRTIGRSASQFSERYPPARVCRAVTA